MNLPRLKVTVLARGQTAPRPVGLQVSPFTIKPLHLILYIPKSGNDVTQSGQIPKTSNSQTKGNTSLLFCTNINTLRESIIRD